jgi:hypothetical protein
VDDGLDVEDFPEQLEKLAVDIVTFLNCLNEFPEFMDEAVNASVLSFRGDLKVHHFYCNFAPGLTYSRKYWASCLQAYKSQFKYPAVQRYIHDLTSEMIEHIDNMTSTVSMFVEIGEQINKHFHSTMCNVVNRCADHPICAKTYRH